MKKFITLCLLIPFAGSVFCQITKNGSNSQGYIRVGINHLGDKLNETLSPEDNALNGQFGAKTGYTLEFGHQFYLHKNSLLPIFPTKIGLDWTYLSLNYSPLDWDSYHKSRTGNLEQGDDESYTYHAGTISTRLGPVISINPIEKLVLDIRVQLDLSYYFNTIEYEEYNDESDTNTKFSFVPDEDDDESHGILSKGTLGLRSNFGITLRRKAWGLSADWTSGKLNAKYAINDEFGKGKVRTNLVSFKLSVTL
ncbi:hypothetical protein SAMN05216436_12098 [bacterium A37T11]|nr:hypothetical protein SAMN05216436_12098 [bacterium A37T11]